MTDRRPGRAPRPVAMIVHAYYEEDPRVRRQAEALVRAGRPVDVIGLRRPDDPAESVVEGVRVIHLDVRRHQGASLVIYLWEYVEFLLRAMVALVRAHRRRRYRLVQVHSLPDFLVFAALPLRLAGVPVLLDLHEAMGDMFRSRFPRAANPLVHGLLVFQERISAMAATHVITVNERFGRRLLDVVRVPPAKLDIVPNAPALSRFDPSRHPHRPFAADGTVRLIYAGALTPIYEVDVVIDAVARLRDRRPDLRVRLDVYGRGDTEPALRAQVERLDLADQVAFHGRIPLEDVPAAIAEADVGLAPTRHDEFTDASISGKLFEYGAMDKVVVASRLPLVVETFGDAVRTYRGGDAAELACVIENLVDEPDRREADRARASERVRELGWEREADRYIALIDRLAGRRGTRP